MKDDHDDNDSGRLFEHDVLGKGVDICYRGKQVIYKSYKKAMSEVIDFVNRTNWLPFDPIHDLCNDIHASVAEELGLDNINHLKVYPAVGSSLDVYHGVDMFFTLGKKVVTVDLTVKEKDDYKADITICPDEVENLPTLAKKISKMF